MQLPSIADIKESNTEGNSVVAVQSPSIADIKESNTEQLIKHLQEKFPKDLVEEDFGILRHERIRGSSFLRLTKEDLMADGMKRGPASVIAGYVEELKGMYP